MQSKTNKLCLENCIFAFSEHIIAVGTCPLYD